MTAPSSTHPGTPAATVPRTTSFTHDWADGDDGEDLATRIVEAVAEITDQDETRVERLYDRLDPDSLNSLFSRTDANRYAGDGLVMFTLEGCTVTVYGSGLVVVQRA
ncbi:HalOD1 output domain-containing protein [Natronosalvus caseinilyticus]|uniref:HalOD1 output domain-containing protein n=1 Tax=Natronosalvus caseinilyticus TaxID=2953747 RepID=UPI0028B0D2BC|nr:HalOD1 output domain-containing protein [Natronosalvus caseinilyticus]